MENIMKIILVILTSLFVSANAFAIDSEVEGDQQDHNYLIRTSLLAPIGGSYVFGFDKALDEFSTLGLTVGIHPKYNGTSVGMDVKHYFDDQSSQSATYFSYKTGLISLSIDGEVDDTQYTADGIGHYFGGSLGTKYRSKSGIAVLFGAGLDYASVEVKVDAKKRGVGIARAGGFTPVVDLTLAYEL